MTTRRKFFSLIFTTAAVTAFGIPTSPVISQAFIREIDYAIVPDPNRFDDLSFNEALKKYIEEIVEALAFELNDDFTRKQITGMLNGFCKKYVNDREIYDYHVICDSRNNLPDDIDKGQLSIDVHYRLNRSVTSGMIMSVKVQSQNAN